MDKSTFMSFFHQAAPYIHAHRSKTFVIHFDADFQLDHLRSVLHDCALLQSLGIKLILVYGMRAQIEKNLQRSGINCEFVANHRITTEEMLPDILDAAGQLRLRIEAALSMNVINSPMQDASVKVCAGNYIIAKPMGVIEGKDFGFTGEIRRINIAAIRSHLQQDEIVLMSPIGFAPSGEIFNLSGEEVASRTASEIGADKLIYISNAVDAYLANNKPRQLTPDEARRIELSDNFLKQRLLAAASACDKGVRRVHLVERDNETALLQELFTRDGAGIMVTGDTYDTLRVATADDINHIIALIKPLEEAGILVPRSREVLTKDIDNFYVLIRDGSIIACCAMYPYFKEQTAELACLAVAPEYRRHRRADYLIGQLSNTARNMGMKSVFLLTTQTAQWFEERGFQRMEIEDLPEKKRLNYNTKRNSKAYRKFL